MTGAADPVFDLPGWVETNQRLLGAALGELRHRLERRVAGLADPAEPEQAPPEVPPALASLATLFGLSGFDRDTLLLCAAAVGLAVAARRRIRDSVAWGATRGQGLAVAGLSCGLTGLAITVVSMALGIAAA